MLFAIYLLIFFGILIFIQYLWNRRKYYVLSWKMESLLGLPFIGLALSIQRPENLLKFISDKRKKFKSQNGLFWLGPQPIVYISEPNLMKKILISSNFVNKMYLYENFAKHFGNGIISSNTPIWNHHRKLMDPSFTYNTVKSFLPIFNEESDILVDKFKVYKGYGEFDIMPVIQLCILDISCRSTMGKHMHFQTNQNSQIIECLANLFKLTIVKSSNPLFYFDSIYDLTKYGKMCYKDKKYVQEFVTNLFNQNLAKSFEIDEKDYIFDDDKKKPKVFLDRGIDLYKNKELSIQDVVDETVTIISGSDTTSNTLSYTIMCLAMFPIYQEKLFDELKNIFPDKNNIDLTAENLKELIFLEMVINENMRIMAPIPLVGRIAKNDYLLDNGIILPKCSQIILDIFNMQREEMNWGENSTIFNPDNFNPENRKNEHSSTFVPFANGNRPCIGNKYAMMVSKTILAKVIRKYKFKTKFSFNDLYFVENVTLKLNKIPLLELEERET